MMLCPCRSAFVYESWPCEDEDERGIQAASLMMFTVPRVAPPSCARCPCLHHIADIRLRLDLTAFMMFLRGLSQPRTKSKQLHPARLVHSNVVRGLGAAAAGAGAVRCQNFLPRHTLTWTLRLKLIVRIHNNTHSDCISNYD
jgi:hypothetical protein